MIERDGGTRKGMNGPWGSFPFSSEADAAAAVNPAFFFLRLGAVFIQQLEQLRSCIFIQGMRELGNGVWDPGAERPFAFGGGRIRAI